jgi:hypothetical protein
LLCSSPDFFDATTLALKLNIGIIAAGNKSRLSIAIVRRKLLRVASRDSERNLLSLLAALKRELLRLLLLAFGL